MDFVVIIFVRVYFLPPPREVRKQRAEVRKDTARNRPSYSVLCPLNREGLGGIPDRGKPCPYGYAPNPVGTTLAVVR